MFYIIIRVHPGYSLVENCDLSEDRRTQTLFSDKPITAILELSTTNDVHDHVKWRAKVFSSHYKDYFGKMFHIFII